MPATSQYVAMNDSSLAGQARVAEAAPELYPEPTRLSDLLGTSLGGLDPATEAAEVREACAQAIVGVLRRAGRSLATLDILDELGHRYHCWTSSTVRHTLADLVERGVLIERRDLRPHGYELAAAQSD